MSERNEEMVRLLAGDAPAARDLAFEVALAARIERRQFWRELAMNAGLALLGAVLLAIVMPGLETFWSSNFAAIGNVALAATLSVLAVLDQRSLQQRG